MSPYWNLLFKYLRPQWRRVSVLAVLLLASIMLPLADPQILRWFIDSATGGASTRTLGGIAVAFIAVVLIAQAVAVATAYAGEQVGWHATNLLRADLALHCLRLDMPFHNRRTPGEMIERVDGDVTALAIFFSRLVITVLGSGLMLLGVLVVLFREDVRVGAVLGIFAVAALLLLNRYREVAVPSATAEREASANLFGFLEERLAGIDDIRANGAGAYVMQRFYHVMRAMFQRKRTAWLMHSSLWVLMEVLFLIGSLIALGMGAYLYRAGAITIGTVFLFFQYTQMLRRPLGQLTQQLREFQRAGAGVSRIHELLLMKPAIVDGRGQPLPAGPLSVEFEHVEFTYGEEGKVIDDLSFHLQPGTVLGLLGRTGSGKTTLTRLLFRLYEPGAGSIRLGGVDVRDARISDLRRSVGIVTQDVQLFKASVRDNLTFFDRGVDDARIVEVLDSLGLAAWRRSLPDGLNTELSSGGGLSAGEAQLLAFARVFLQNPGLVLLDEASSRLDPATQQLIERAVDRLFSGRTAIVIAHRLSTVQRASQILILEQGRVRERGDREALASDPRSRFAGLLRAGMEEVLV